MSNSSASAAAGQGLSGLTKFALTAAAILVVLTVWVMTFGSAGTPPKPATVAGQGSGTGLNAGAIPDQALVRWIESAGSICPQVTAPLIAAQLDAESGFNPKAVSPRGALGIAQFEPDTWAIYGQDANHNGKNSPFDPADAITAQGRYMCQLAHIVAKVPGDKTSLILAGYNAGPAAVVAAGGIPGIIETIKYIHRIKGLLPHFTATSSSGGSAGSVPTSGLVQAAIAAAKSQIGTPYQFGGGGYTSCPCDCSSLMQYAWYHASHGTLELPRTTYDQLDASGPNYKVEPVAWNKIQAGDLLFFATGVEPGWGHVAMYLGDGQLIEDPHTGSTVRIEPLKGYYLSVPHTARRIITTGTGPSAGKPKTHAKTRAK